MEKYDKKLIITFLIILMSVGVYADDNPKDKDGNTYVGYFDKLI